MWGVIIKGEGAVFGGKFGGHADVNDHYQHAKFACLGPLREIAGGLMFL